MENTFPPAVVDRINGLRVSGVKAEFVKLGGVKMAPPNQPWPHKRFVLFGKNAITYNLMVVRGEVTADRLFHALANATSDLNWRVHRNH